MRPSEQGIWKNKEAIFGGRKPNSAQLYRRSAAPIVDGNE